MTLNEYNYNIFLLNKFYKTFFRYSTILNIVSYKSNIPTKFINIFIKKLKFIMYVLSIYINFLILYLKFYITSILLLV
jgi:hypothetical protein